MALGREKKSFMAVEPIPHLQQSRPADLFTVLKLHDSLSDALEPKKYQSPDRGVKSWEKAGRAVQLLYVYRGKLQLLTFSEHPLYRKPERRRERIAFRR